jgi:hypothetical protein
MLADFGGPKRSCWHNLEDQLFHKLSDENSESTSVFLFEYVPTVYLLYAGMIWLRSNFAKKSKWLKIIIIIIMLPIKP